MSLLSLAITTTKWAFIGLSLYAGKLIITTFVIDPLRSPLRNLPGPPVEGWLHSHLPRMMSSGSSPAAYREYVEKYGRSFRVKGFGYHDDRLVTFDPKAILYILNNIQIYEKPWQSRRIISKLIGEGLISSEGLHHKKQRKVMNPAFSPTNLRVLTPLFVLKAYELKGRWMELLASSEAESLDVAHWLSRATFDIIGLAGFGYALNAITNEEDELYTAYREMFDVTINNPKTPLRQLIALYAPWVDRILPSSAHQIVQRCHKVIYGVGNKLLQEKKRAFLEGKTEGSGPKDLLSLLIKTNLSDVSIEQQITDQDILDQINTFFFVGSDSTSLAVAWTLYHLAEQPETQARLREELMQALPDEPENPDELDFDAIDALPFLDKVSKEGLRLVPPISSTLRAPVKDDVIPTTFPITLQNGQSRHGIPIQKGQFIHIPIEGLNLDRTVWGDDAWDFKPDRWDSLPETVRGQPGLWANMMPFSTGPRACIGFRFSIIEMKVFLFVLLRAFTFEFDPKKVVFKANVVLTRPFVKGEYAKGPQLPLKVTPFRPHTT